MLVVLTTIGAGLLDYVFKARAVAAHPGGADLVRFFAIFYTAIGVITFLVQIAFSRLSLEKFGTRRHYRQPSGYRRPWQCRWNYVPGLGATAVARGSESVLRSSLFRSGYELFFAAVPVRHRRGIKPILDVGFERIGDMLGGLLISALLLVPEPGDSVDAGICGDHGSDRRLDFPTASSRLCQSVGNEPVEPVHSHRNIRYPRQHDTRALCRRSAIRFELQSKDLDWFWPSSPKLRIPLYSAWRTSDRAIPRS